MEKEIYRVQLQAPSISSALFQTFLWVKKEYKYPQQSLIWLPSTTARLIMQKGVKIVKTPLRKLEIVFESH